MGLCMVTDCLIITSTFSGKNDKTKTTPKFFDQVEMHLKKGNKHCTGCGKKMTEIK